ncbi:MAG: hypothetical protein ACMUFK_04140 [Thermoplasmatota archaeon]
MNRDNINKFVTVPVVIMITFASLIAFADDDTDELTRADYPYPAKVHLKLEYANRTPAQGFTVNVLHYFRPSYEVRTFSTDLNGEAVFQLQVWDWGPCRIWAYDSGETYFWKSDLYVEPNGIHYLNGTVGPPLPLDNHLSGTVRDSVTGLPMSGVVVEVEGKDDLERPVSNSSNTAIDGAFSFMLPDSREPYQLYATYAGYDDYSAEVYMVSDLTEYTIEIWLRETYIPATPIHIKAFNSTTGMEFEVDHTSLNGLSADADNTMHYDSSYAMNTTTGYYDMIAGFGEYEVYVNTKLDPILNVSFQKYDYLIVNDTDIFHHFDMWVPSEWRQVNIHINNGTDPIWYAHVDYRHPFKGAHIMGEAYADMAGYCNLFIPAGEDIDIEFWYYGYVRQYRNIPAGPASSIVDLDITLEESKEDKHPKEQVSLLVIDEVSGLPMPQVSVYGNGYFQEGDYWISISGMTSTDGYLNTTADVGFYDSVDLHSTFGTGSIENVTIVEGTPNELTGVLSRTPFPPEPVQVQFRLVTREGEPVASHPVSLMDLGPSSRDYVPMSDLEGWVRLYIPPGDYSIQLLDDYDCVRGSRTSWAMEYLKVTIEAEGTLPDIVLLPAKPLYSIEGFVKDSTTGKVIPQQPVSSSSYHRLDIGPTRQMPYVMGYWELFHEMDGDRFYYFNEWGGSNGEGFYRVWGGEKVVVAADREGYYHYSFEMDRLTRGDADHDILMEPVPSYTTFVNGTLVDQDGNPLEGFVAILDVAHDHYVLDETLVNSSGEFSLECYPGQLRALFGNETLWDYMDIEVPSDGIEGLELVLAPTTFINGTVKDWKGDPVPDINVTLEDRYDTPVMALRWTTTGADGSFSFEVGRGSYGLFIDETELYHIYSSDPIVTLGWEPVYMDIILVNRTKGTLFGKVEGSGGPLAEGIPGARIHLSSPSFGYIETIFNTDENGNYSLTLPYASDWTMLIEPPLEHTGIEDIRTGYLPNTIDNITIFMFRQEMNVILAYIEVQGVELVNVTEWGPVGEDIPLNEIIWLSFTHPMDMESVESSLLFDPAITVTGYDWNHEGNRVFIHHEDLLQGTNYTVKLMWTAVSETGLPLWDPTGFSWTFRTGSDVMIWTLVSRDVEVLSDRSVKIGANGGEGQTVFFVIVGIDSFLLEEEGPGVYNGTFNGGLLEWNTTYEYYFSNSWEGPDMAPALRGTFRTPAEEIVPIDDDDDDVVDDDGLSTAGKVSLLICGLVLLVLLVIALVVFLLARRKGEEWEEE